MRTLTLRQRVVALEKKVSAVETALREPVQARDWRQAVGVFTGDEEMLQIFEQAMRIRERDRERFKLHGKRRRAKS